MIHKCILASILIFNFLLCNCQLPGEVFYTDILNTGYNFLQIAENDSADYQQINFLWNKLTWARYYEMLPNLDSRLIMQRFGIPESMQPACLNADGLGTIKDARKVCGQRIVDNIKIIESLQQHIARINEYFTEINSLEILFSYDPDDAFTTPDGLYEYINDICVNTSTCFFHAMTGNHILPMSETRPISTRASISGEIYYAYLTIAFYFLKGYATEIYRCRNTPDTPHKAKIIEVAQVKFLMHTHRIAKIALSAIKNAPRDITLGEPTQDETSPYIQLKWFIGQIIVNEANLNPTGTCWRTCDSYAEARFKKFGNVPFQGKDVCNGTISQCYLQFLGYVCPTKNDARRYAGVQWKWWRLGDGSCDDDDSRATNKVYYVKPGTFDDCDVCTCLCDDHQNPKTIRTFSLREVTSNIAENMVITGLRLREIDGTIYIDIWEGQLETIDVVRSVRWVPTNTFDKTVFPNDSFTLRYPSQSFVNLDTISTADDFVRKHIEEMNQLNDIDYPVESYLLTGVKFGTENGRLNFGIRLTAWRLKERKFALEKRNMWIFNNDVKNRKKIDLGYPDVPTKTNDNVEVEGNNYVQFQPTDNTKDFGQTTVPFLDARHIITHPPMPLSGAGLFYKGKPGYGGVIGLKLISIDFSLILVTEVLRADNVETTTDNVETTTDYVETTTDYVETTTDNVESTFQREKKAEGLTYGQVKLNSSMWKKNDEPAVYGTVNYNAAGSHKIKQEDVAPKPKVNIDTSKINVPASCATEPDRLRCYNKARAQQCNMMEYCQEIWRKELLNPTGQVQFTFPPRPTTTEKPPSDELVTDGPDISELQKKFAQQRQHNEERKRLERLDKSVEEHLKYDHP